MKQFEAVFYGFLALEPTVRNNYEALEARAWQARVMMTAGHFSEAEVVQREVLRFAEEVEPNFSDISLAVMDQLTSNLIGQEKWSEAMVELAQMMRMLDMYTAPDHNLRRLCLKRMLQAHAELGDSAGRDAALRELNLWEESYGNSQ